MIADRTTTVISRENWVLLMMPAFSPRRFGGVAGCGCRGRAVRRHTPLVLDFARDCSCRIVRIAAVGVPA